MNHLSTQEVIPVVLEGTVVELLHPFICFEINACVPFQGGCLPVTFWADIASEELKKLPADCIGQ